MPPIPTTTTDRYIVRQLWRGRAFSTLHRFPAGSSQFDALGALDGLYTAIAGISYTNWSIQGIDYIPAGSTISQPADTSGFPSAGTSANDPGTLPDAYQIQVLGRTIGGTKVSWYHQGLIAELDANMRLVPAENPDVGTLLAAYATAIALDMCAVDGFTPVPKPYVNVVINDYLTRRSRRG